MYIISSSCQIANLAAIYQQYFGNKSDGTFVEVGASDGISFSNTWGLAKMGWTGLYYEPVHELYNRCIINHAINKVTVVNACVGDYNGMVKLFLGSNPTIDEETIRKEPWDTHYTENNSIMVPIVTLNDDLPKHAWPEKFDLLCVDVEGAELQVLRGIDLQHYQPRMIILELCENHPVPKKRMHVDEINKHMNVQLYTKIQSDTVNAIYWRNDAKRLG